MTPQTLMTETKLLNENKEQLKPIVNKLKVDYLSFANNRNLNIILFLFSVLCVTLVFLNWRLFIESFWNHSSYKLGQEGVCAKARL